MINFDCEMISDELKSIIPSIKGSDCVYDIVKSVTDHINKLELEIAELKRENSLLKAKALYDVIKIN